MYLRSGIQERYRPAPIGKSKGRCIGSPCPHAFRAEVRLFDHLFKEMDPEEVPAGRRLAREPESRLAGSAARSVAWSPAWQTRSRASIFSSNDWATSWPIRSIRSPGNRSSIVPCRCAIPGPRSSNEGSKAAKNSSGNKLPNLSPLSLPSPPLFPLRGAVEREWEPVTYFRTSPKHRHPNHFLTP